MNPSPLATLAQFMMGIAWASCWPASLPPGGIPHPGLILLGAGCAVLPDCLDDWLVRPFYRPDLHIVPPPEAPDPGQIATALAQAVAFTHLHGKALDLICYPLLIGPDQWRPYALLLESSPQQIAVTLSGANPIGRTAPIPVGLITDHSQRLTIHRQPLSIRILPETKDRVRIMIMPTEQQWTHSLLTGAALGLTVAALWGLTAGAIACGAHALHVLINQWSFTGSALLWPIRRKRYPGFQWFKPHQSHNVDFALLWGSLLLILGNLLHAATPPLIGPSRFQLLLFGGVIPFALGSLFRVSPARVPRRPCRVKKLLKD